MGRIRVGSNDIVKIIYTVCDLIKENSESLHLKNNFAIKIGKNKNNCNF